MKDITITAKRVKKEFVVLLSCFITAFLLNIVAIIIYKTPWYEIFSQIGYVTVIALVFYLIAAAVRGIIVFIKGLLK